MEELCTVREPCLHFHLRAGKWVTWRAQSTLTETERLVASEASPSESSSTESEGSTCESGAGGVSSSSSGKVMGELGRSNFSMTRFLVARPRLLPIQTRETTSSDREEVTCSGGLLRLPVFERDGCGMVVMRDKRQSVAGQRPSATADRTHMS